MNLFLNLSCLVFLERYLYFSLSHSPLFLPPFASYQNTAVSPECSLMNSSSSGPSTFICSNASTFSSLNLQLQSLSTTLMKLKNFPLFH